MCCRFFVKHSFFCVMVLSIGIHATSSIAESSNRLPKTTSVLSLFAKAVVMGLAFGSQIQVLASPFSQKSKHSLDKRQEQQDSNVCVSNSDDIFYVGQNNLTRCLEQNPRGTFIFVERVNFTQFSEDEKNKYPMYNDSTPFSGSLTMFPYSFDHFNITRSGPAAMFFKIENANIRANLTHSDVIGDIVSSSIAPTASGYNTLDIELDSASVKTVGSENYAGGIIAILNENSINHLSVRVKNYLNVRSINSVGGLIRTIGGNASLNLNAIIDTLFIECLGHGSACGGIIGVIEKDARVKVNVQGSLIHVVALLSFNQRMGALYGEVRRSVMQLNANMQIDNVSIEGRDRRSTGSVVYAQYSTNQFVNHQATLIRGMHVKIEVDRANAIGIGSSISNSMQEISPIYLLSINGTLGSPNHILAPQGVSCEGSMIDWSGVHLNTTNLGCDGTLELETLRPEHWREAHRLVAIELCQDQNNCFYVHEDLLALVKERDNSFFLVTRQRYPYNNANDGQGVVRVIQYILNDPQYNPTMNSSFAINGTRLFTNATEELLPVERPLSTSLTDNRQLLMLYGETGNLKVASMPIMGKDDATYAIHTVQSNAAPVQIDKDTLWLNQDGHLLAYKVFDASTEIFSRNTILPSSVNLIGAQRYQDYVYTAQSENDTHIFMARFFNDGRQDAHWTSSLPLPNDYDIRQLHIEGDANEPIIFFPKVSELFRADFLNDFYLTIEIPLRGGAGEWRYSNESFIQTLLPATEPPTIVSTTDALGNMTTTKTITPVDIMNSTDGNPNNNGGNGGTIAAGILVPIFLIGSSTAAAVVAVIVCHKKKVPCFVNLEKKFMPHLKKCCVSCKKTEASDL